MREANSLKRSNNSVGTLYHSINTQHFSHTKFTQQEEGEPKKNKLPCHESWCLNCSLGSNGCLCIYVNRKKEADRVKPLPNFKWRTRYEQHLKKKLIYSPFVKSFTIARHCPTSLDTFSNQIRNVCLITMLFFLFRKQNKLVNWQVIRTFPWNMLVYKNLE